MFRLGVALLFVPLLVAQQQDDAALPAVSRLGPIPESVPVIALEPTGVPGSSERELAVTLGTAREVVLRASADTSTATVLAALDQLRAQQVQRVHFAARLPVGQATGALTLGLADPTTATTELELRLSFERPGVPPECLTPHLQRMVDGVIARNLGPLRLRVVVPPDGTLGNLLGVLAAVASSGAPPVLLVAGEAAAGASAVRPQRFALDLGPSPAVQIPAVAIPAARPEVTTSSFGLDAADATPTKIGTDAGGAGGRYGGRRGGAGGRARSEIQERISNGLDWLMANQRPDGGWAGVDGQSDPETTAWIVLSLLGDGQSMDGCAAAPIVARGVGFLMAQQNAHGLIGDGISIRRHAIATYALAEAYGLSSRGCLLRGATSAALEWLRSHTCENGGWSDDGTGSSDPLVTVHAAMAIESARFFRLSVGITREELVAWLPAEPPLGDSADSGIPEAGPAVAFALAFLGVGKTPIGAATALAERVTVTDERLCYWTSYALFQVGGRPWLDWSKKLATMPNARTDGPDKGSWDPPPGMSRAMASALRVLSLQAYYRYTKLVR
ncbi:MAG: terpene cyclase/mutase family protein [Planctomycetes bacterium]|nr:terpene cyclase/mutase family protein [Planctomycetota bacterium]